MIDLKKIPTEQRNINSKNIDKVDTNRILKIINDEDKIISNKVELAIPSITIAVDTIFERVQKGGRVFFMGAGTSGRIGVLDASEILPTYGNDDIFFGIIAGGEKAIKIPMEGAEDDEVAAVKDLKGANLGELDSVIGIGASGRTPYVKAGLKYAKDSGANAIGLCMNPNNEFEDYSNLVIVIDTGAEVITGSTRMKSGTATKMVCNMISTSIMIKKGFVYENLMINLKPTNKKLEQRSINIIKEITSSNDDFKIRKLLEKHDWKIVDAVKSMK